jgi:hypothetical protein
VRLAEGWFEAQGQRMREASYVIAFFGGLVLLAAAWAWWKVVSEPEEEPTEGRVGVHSKRVKDAARATAIAFALSGIAAILAVVDWFMR